MYGLAVISMQRSEGPSARQPSGCNNLLDLGSAEEGHRALRNVANAGPFSEASQGRAEHPHRAALVRKEAEDRTDQGGFPRTVATYQSHSLSGPYREADPAQHR